MSDSSKDFSYEEFITTKAAWYYYEENMTQQQIADKLGVNRMKVIKLLESARQRGIIQFNFRSDSARRLARERQLLSKYSLKDCFIVPPPNSGEGVNENAAKAAAMYIASRIRGETFINIGYGDTAGRVLNHLTVSTEHRLSCVSLTGGVSHYLPSARSNIFNSRLYLIPAPLLLSSDEVAGAMEGEKAIKDIKALIPLSSMSVIGIGAMNQDATVIKSGVLTANDFLLLKRNGAVGDILSHFINEDGTPVSSDLEARTISTPLDTIKKLPNVIGVAAGLGKVEAIRAVLRGEYLDVLVTDEDTADALIKRDKG